MKTRDMAELAGRNLREAFLRNALTTLGVTVGISALVAILSLAVGLQDLASSRLTRSGLFDAVFVTSRRMMAMGGGPGAGGGGPRQRQAAVKDAKPLDEDARQSFASIPGVTDVYPQIRFVTDLRYEGSNYSTSVASLPDSLRKSGAFEGMTGKFFSSPTADEAILHTDFAKELAPGQVASLIGKELTLRYVERVAAPPAQPAQPGKPKDIDAEMDELMPGGGASFVPHERKLHIVGITEMDPSVGFGGMGGGRVYIPLHVAEGLHVAQPTDMQDLMREGGAGKPSYMALTVRLKSPKEVTRVEAAIKQMGYSTFSLLDLEKGLKVVFVIFDGLLGMFGSVALTVAAFGIVNTLVMAILERRREIGVLKALGASDGDISKLFFVEAGSIGFAGGVLGVFFGWLIGQIISLGLSIYLRTQEITPVTISSVPWWLVLVAIGIAVVVSLLAGLYPARRAARLNPVEALRYE
jgi:putative ABC transport system permease protein